MMGGAWFQEVFGDPEAVMEEHLLARATEAVRCHLGVSTAPCWSWVALQRVWSAVNSKHVCDSFKLILHLSKSDIICEVSLPLQDCIPQYYQGHFRRVGECRLLRLTMIHSQAVVNHHVELRLCLSRVHAALHKGEESLAVSDWFLLRWRGSQRCHLQWTDGCRGAVGNWSLMEQVKRVYRCICWVL